MRFLQHYMGYTIWDARGVLGERNPWPIIVTLNGEYIDTYMSIEDARSDLNDWTSWLEESTEDEDYDQDQPVPYTIRRYNDASVTLTIRQQYELAWRIARLLYKANLTDRTKLRRITPLPEYIVSVAGPSATLELAVAAATSLVLSCWNENAYEWHSPTRVQRWLRGMSRYRNEESSQ